MFNQGLSAPKNPDLLFVLKQKVSKKHLLPKEKVKGKKYSTAPASLEKLTLSWLKPSKL